jgi:SAM-dependent methyltransferase
MNAALRNLDRPPPIADLARCLTCASALCGSAACPRCGHRQETEEGILAALGPLSGNNLVAARFYDGPGWVRFRPWERLFLRLVGGRVRARREILRHLPDRPGASVLEVGIGDGENLDLLPRGVSAYGVDLARTQLAACLKRDPAMARRLALAEAEALPFPDATFDACYSVGGFNYFRDPPAALAEMRRVTRPDGLVIVADERPDLKRYGLGHLIGLPAFDAWWMRLVGLPAEFVAMVQATEIDPDAMLRGLSPSSRRLTIWKGLGFALIDPDPSRRQP